MVPLSGGSWAAATGGCRGSLTSAWAAPGEGTPPNPLPGCRGYVAAAGVWGAVWGDSVGSWCGRGGRPRCGGLSRGWIRGGPAVGFERKMKESF